MISILFLLLIIESIKFKGGFKNGSKKMGNFQNEEVIAHGMKLLIFIHSLSNGGAERVTANLANYWVQKGWDITVVTLASSNLDFYELHPAVKRVALDLADESRNALAGMWNNIHRVFALRRILREIQPNIALGMMSGANVLLALAALGLSNLRTIGAEHNHPPQSPLGYLWETLRRHTYRFLNAVAVLTSEGEEWIKHNTYAQKISVIPNGVVYPLLTQEPQIKPNTSKRKVLLAVGRLNEGKGFNLLIESFSNLSAKHSDWDLIILGEGSLRPTLEKQIRDLDLEKRIFIPGRAGNIGEWYETADIFVMSSHFEGFPMTLIEAMAYGLPAVSFDCDTGPRDIIRHEVDGFLVPLGNVIALTNTLNNIMSDDKLRLRLATRAIEVRDRFSMERITGLWEKLFDEIYKK
jgi:glycosyltransferase involved in cell wall biosynthesis